MQTYSVAGCTLNSVELKCLLVSKGVKVDKNVYAACGAAGRVNINPLTCNCLLLPDGTVSQMTDVSFHMDYLAGNLSWSNLKLMRYASQLYTPFRIRLCGDVPTLFHEKEEVCPVSFPPKTAFYGRKTSGGMPFIGNAVLQGLDWVAFQCLWPCEYAMAGKSCQFCFSGADFQTCAAKKRALPVIPTPQDVAEVIRYAVGEAGCTGVQLTGGSTFDSADESAYISRYMEAIRSVVGRENIPGEVLLYITPPEDPAVIDGYFEQGASRIGCSIEVWDEERAGVITPGKIEFTTRQRHLDVLRYIAGKYGPGKAFSNFIIGIEEFDTLRQGAETLAREGILPTASVWMPFGRPVMGTMLAPGVDFYRRVIDLYAQLYVRYGLEPPASHGLNVCIERDIWNYAGGLERQGVFAGI